MDKDPLEEALRIAVAPTVKRILEERERLPHQLSALMLYIAKHLCEPGFNATRAKRATKVSSHTLATLFRDHLDVTLRVYIEIARLEVADRLLRRTGLKIGQISLLVGYSCHETFLRVYKAWAGESPRKVRDRSAAPGVDYPTWRKAWYRELDTETARDLIEKLVRLYPDVGKLVPEEELEDEPPSLRLPIDAEPYMRFQAEEVWRQVRELPPEVQGRCVRECDFRSRALFDLLREKSREEGRRDRQQGIFLARLALDSLEGMEEFFGERIHDLRALGHAWLANAHRLAFDFSAADTEFDRADTEWRVPRRTKDIQVQARIYDLKSSLRIFQRNYREALLLVEHTQEIFQMLGDPRGEARSLIQRASIHCNNGDLENSITALQMAKCLLNKQNEPHLEYVVHCNLASDLARVGRYPAAVENLTCARGHCERLERPLGTLRILWVDAAIKQATGDLCLAENLFVSVRTGYAEAQELPSFGIVSLDLAILYSELGRWTKVLDVASEAVPILSSSRFHEETLTAVNLLARAVEAGEVSAMLLRHVRDKVMQDPYVGFSL